MKYLKEERTHARDVFCVLFINVSINFLIVSKTWYCFANEKAKTVKRNHVSLEENEEISCQDTWVALRLKNEVLSYSFSSDTN